MEDLKNLREEDSQAEATGIGWAVKQMVNGKKVTRKGWHGVGQYLELQVPDENSKMTLPYIYINIPCQNCAQAGEKPSGFNLVPWLASQTDILAVDWVLV